MCGIVETCNSKYYYTLACWINDQLNFNTCYTINTCKTLCQHFSLCSVQAKLNSETAKRKTDTCSQVIFSPSASVLGKCLI